MESVLSIMFFVLLAREGLAGHHKKHNIAVSNPIVGKTGHISAKPVAIQESQPTKTCPLGFEWAGHKCEQRLTAPQEVHCPSGYSRAADTKTPQGVECAKYSGKLARCDPGYTPVNGMCVHKQETEPEATCPSDFSLTVDGRQCSRVVPLRPTHYCPSGSVEKGDSCVIHQTHSAQYVCASGYNLEGDRCIFIETFDCTPLHTGKEGLLPSSLHGHYFRQLGQKHNGKHSGKKSHSPLPAIHTERAISAATVTEYIIEKTCRRIRSEEARRVCTKGSYNGAHCVTSNTTPKLQKPGGFKEEFIPVSLICPEQFYPAGKEALTAKSLCIKTTEVLPNLVCHEGTHDLGNKCVKYIPPKLTCPLEYHLESGICTKTVYAEPLIEYSVTYACTGKDCAKN